MCVYIYIYDEQEKIHDRWIKLTLSRREIIHDDRSCPIDTLLRHIIFHSRPRIPIASSFTWKNVSAQNSDFDKYPFNSGIEQFTLARLQRSEHSVISYFLYWLVS